MTLSDLPPTQREAAIACVVHGALRRTRGGYRPMTPGVHPFHSSRAIGAIVRAGLAEWTDGEVEIQPTAAARELVADAAAASH